MDLLLYLHALVSGDAAVPGFRGRLVFGVTSGDATTWWSCEFAERARGEFVKVPADADCVVKVSDAEAEAMLSGGPVSFTPEHIAGDRKMLQRFAERYLAKQTMLNLRSSLQKKGS